MAALRRTLAWPCTFRLYEENDAMVRPHGRPLVEHLWRDGEWLHVATGMPFDEDVYRAGVLRRQAACERRRYWDPSTGVWDGQRERNKLLAAARPLKRKRHAEQLALDHVRSDNPIRNENLKEISNDINDWQPTSRWRSAANKVRELFTSPPSAPRRQLH